MKQITNENLLHSTGNTTQCSVVTWAGRKFKTRGDIRVTDSLFCTVESNQHRKATPIKNKTKQKNQNIHPGSTVWFWSSLSFLFSGYLLAFPNVWYKTNIVSAMILKDVVNVFQHYFLIRDNIWMLLWCQWHMLWSPLTSRTAVQPPCQERSLSAMLLEVKGHSHFVSLCQSLPLFQLEFIQNSCS